LFWTISVPSDSVDIALGDGSAEFALEGLETSDHHDIVNSLERGPSIPATASFNVQWGGVKRRFTVRDAANGFGGTFVETAATIEWSSSDERLDFVSDPADTSTTVSALIGRERNGVFFQNGDQDNEENDAHDG